jgi:hypothetical protein
MSLGLFISALAVGSAALALWTAMRFPDAGPASLRGAMAQVALALVAGALLVPRGMEVAIGWSENAGPMLAVFLFAVPGLVYLFLSALWVMRILQQMLPGVRR